MSRRVTLYIGGLKADLPDESPIQLTWTREELDNPTAVRNSYTQQLTLPGTPANDAIFGHFGRVERATQAVPGVTTGVAYNPLKKADFALYSEDMTVLARGYAKLDKIASRGDQAVSYGVSLYGGLGSLFYELTYASDGSERSLADLTYKDVNDADVDPATEGMSVDAQTLRGLWDAQLLDPTPDWRNILTYAPCYNGLPAGDFDANKAIVTSSAWYNFPTPNNGYNPLAGAGQSNPILATFASKHTEWEVRDFRAYLQRPAVSVKAVLEALTDSRNTGDWSLALSGDFFTDGNNPWYDKAWMTLPMLSAPAGGDWTSLHLADALGGSMTPAAFLIGYAKMFGLIFHVDESAQSVTLMTRDDYYGSAATRDLSERVDIDTVSIKPCNASARWYEFKAKEVDAEYSKEYEETYGRVYGSQRIDTGWEFDSAVKDLLPTFPFRGAADVLETSPNYYSNYYNGYPGLAVVDTEAVKYKLYDGSGNAQDFDAYVGQYLSKTVYWYNGTYNGHDAFPKAQLHGADGKASDGAFVLLINTGDETLPNIMRWQTSDDTADMATLNDGRPCWLLDGNGYTLSKMPAFRRMAGAQTMDFGAPREIAVPGESTGEGASVYYNRWKGYLEDRLDVDTKVLTCKVDWRGTQVGAALLRDFFWYRNSLWSLNKISNYAPTVDGLTECEFVQVRDADAYDASQLVPALANWYLNATPGTLAFLPAGESKTLTITSNVAWTLTAPAWITASAASGSGNASVTLTADANSGSDRSGSVALSGAHSTSASVSVSQETAFVPSLSVSPNNRTYDANARTFYYTVTCNGRWRVKSISGAWITCTSSGTGNGTATISIAANTGSNRTAYIMWEMTDYPTTTYTTYITQSAPAATITYAVELGTNPYTFPAGGGSLTQTVTGKTYSNGTLTSSVTLTTSDLTITRTGSTAVSRSDLVFSAADLGTTVTSEQTSTFTITWNANSTSATFTAKQSANTRTQTSQSSSWSHHLPSTITWTVSDDSLADWQGDYTTVSSQVDEVTTTTYSYDSGATSSASVTVAHTGTLSVSGVGYYLNNSTLGCTQNNGHTQRSGTLTLAYDIGEPDVPDVQYVTRSLLQDRNPALPTGITVQIGSDFYPYASPSTQLLYPDVLRWTRDDASAPYQYVYTVRYPSVGDKAYSNGTLATEVGTLTNVTY